MTLSEREQSAGPPARWVAIRPRTAVLRQVLVQVLAPQEGAAGAAARPCSPLWRAFGPGGGVGAERRLCADAQRRRVDIAAPVVPRACVRAWR